jgi:iron complex outermembrane receptor protein
MKKFLQVLSVLLITSFTATAQTGEIQGRVLDDKGEPVPFALVIVIRDQAGKDKTSKGTKADANGRYTLKGLNPGTYNLMATSVGKPSAIELYKYQQEDLQSKTSLWSKRVILKSKLILLQKHP